MKKIIINVVFNGKGHGNINVFPTNYNQWNVSSTSPRDYNLDNGDYSITYLTATEFGGEIVVTEGVNILQSVLLDKGVSGGNFDFTI